MVSFTKNPDIISGRATELVCLSTDTKPTKYSQVDPIMPETTIANGSTLIEMDTSSIYFFDSATETWLQF